MVDYLKVGQIINVHGVKGEIKLYPLTDDIKRFSKLKFVYLESEGEYQKYPVEGVKYSNNLVILKLAAINDMNEALKYRDRYVYIDRDNAVRLPKDSYFIADLIGIDVYTIEGQRLGAIISVFPTGSNDVYEVKAEDDRTILIPAIKDVVKSVDIEGRKMTIELLEGLL
jgi:16S rRNA processing protein RimM